LVNRLKHFKTTGFFLTGLPVASLSLMGITLQAKTDPKKEVRDQADKLFDEGKYVDLLSFLVQQESWYDCCDLLWRVGRCKFHISKDSSLDDHKRQEYLRDSLVNVERALQLNPDCGPAHKWAAILIDSVSSLDGTRARIEQTLNVKRHMEESIRLMPQDATSYYLLGEWHYSVCMTSWVERQIAAVVFAKLPDASLEDALKMFLKAEEVDPGFYSRNLLYLSKTLMSLNRNLEDAKEYLIRVVSNFKDSTKWDDKEAVAEARILLKKLGVKDVA
jgi:tetratricopeptide (TPR) repeat protein